MTTEQSLTLHPEQQLLDERIEELKQEFLALYVQHTDMIDNQKPILSSIYYREIGVFQLELLEKETEASRLKMKIKMIQAAYNKGMEPDLTQIEMDLSVQLRSFYEQMQEQAQIIEEADKLLSNLMSPEETKKIRDLFRLLTKRLHPDLNPNQTEEEKDLYIKVVAAYDLNRINELQEILLYLDGVDYQSKALAKSDKQQHIDSLKQRIHVLTAKIVALYESFPFILKDYLIDDDAVAQKQEELKVLIQVAEDEITKYQATLKLMLDE